MTESSSVRRAQKAAQFLREISQLFLVVAQDNAELRDLYPTRVSFSADAGICIVHFYSPKGREYFEEKLPTLKLFKPSLRAAMAKRIQARMVPDFRFVYDDEMEKQQKMDNLIQQLKERGTF